MSPRGYKGGMQARWTISTRELAATVTVVVAALPRAQTPAEQVAAAAEVWLSSDQVDERALQHAVQVFVELDGAAIRWLAAELPAMLASPATPRAKGVRALATHFVIGFLEKQRKTEMVWVGQYDALQRLQPFSADLLFRLLLETPDWYPLTFRVHLVAPLRDLQPKAPPRDTVAAVQKIAADDQEPEDLRRALAAMLWQWGDHERGTAVVQRLQRATTEGEAEDRVNATLELADYHVLLREYKAAAMTHRAAEALAKGCGVPLRPVAWYAAACVHALLGDVERGIESLDRCATMLASPDLDSSLRIKRALFDQDPELAALRRDARFAALVEKAFGKPNPAGGR